MSNLRQVVKTVSDLAVDIVESTIKIKDTIVEYKSTIKLKKGDTKEIPPKD